MHLCHRLVGCGREIALKTAGIVARGVTMDLAGLYFPRHGKRPQGENPAIRRNTAIAGARGVSHVAAEFYDRG